jgi:hypothetical protein
MNPEKQWEFIYGRALPFSDLLKGEDYEKQ